MLQLSEGWENSESNSNWVPVESVLGRSKMPSGTAKKVKQAIDSMIARKELKSDEIYKALET